MSVLINAAAVGTVWGGRLSQLGRHRLGLPTPCCDPLRAPIAPAVERLYVAFDSVSLLAGGPGRSGWQDGRTIRRWPGFDPVSATFPSA